VAVQGPVVRLDTSRLPELARHLADTTARLAPLLSAPAGVTGGRRSSGSRPA
jgi:hypothetical protein